MKKIFGSFRNGKRRKEELEWIDFDEDENEYDLEEEDGYEDEYYEDEDEVEDAEYEEEYYENEDEIEDAEYEEEYYEDEDEIEDAEYEEEYYEDEDEADDTEYEEEYYEDEDEIEDAEYEEEYYEDEDEIEDAEYDLEEEDGYEDEYYEDEYDSDYDEDEYYEYEDEDDDYYGSEDEEKGGVGAVIYKLTHLPAADYAVAFTGVAVLVLALVTGGLYLNARNIKKQVETFAEIGVGLDGINMIGEEGLVAIADAHAAKVMAASMEPEDWLEDEGQEDPDDGKNAQVKLNLSSIQKDLKIKFVNSKTGKLISNIAFEVKIEKPSGETYTKTDDDKDGIIYQTELAPGKYNVQITSPSSHEDFEISGEKVAITVRDTIEYKKVDVADEVKTESQVNAAVEDTKVNETVVESANTDTVEWVESTKTIIEGTQKTEDSYEKVDYSKDIADPAAKAGIGFRLLTAEDKEPVPYTVDDPETSNPDTTEPDPSESTDPEPDPGQTGEPETPSTAPEETETPTPDPTPEEKPTEAPTPTPEEKPTDAPTPTVTPTALPTHTPAVSATPAHTPSVTPTASVKPSATPSATPTATPNKAKNDTTTTLKTTGGEVLYVKDGDKYREAKYADYYKTKEFYRKKTTTKGEYRYTGWQVIEGVTYFFDKNGNKVTGEQIILGAKYSFNSDGSLNKTSGSFGIDVSKWNGDIDWNAVKNSGVSYVIIRCGYRGSTTGALIEDPKYRANIKGALGAGIKVGIYFFTQAVNEVEAVEEASMVLGLVKGYNISFPIVLDVEPSGGRADGISVATRTAVCKAFCQTIQNSGYKAGVYANKTWFNEKIDTPSITGYKIWLAQYAAAPSYNRTRYDIWQYSSKGSVPGIKGSVDLNTSYMGY